MINFLDLFACAYEAVVKSLSESGARFNPSHWRENTTLRTEAVLCLVNGWVEVEAERFKANFI